MFSSGKLIIEKRKFRRMVDGSFRTDWQMDWMVSAVEVGPVSGPEEVPEHQTVPGTEPEERSLLAAARTADGRGHWGR